MARRIIGRQMPSVRKGVYDIQEAYDYSLENKWSNYTDITVVSGSWIFFDSPNGYRTIIFPGSSTFEVNSSGDQSGIEYIVIGGGGGGGTGIGGGGGAGQVKQGRINAQNGSYTVTVGAGGAQSLNPGGPTGTIGPDAAQPRTSYNGGLSRLSGPNITITSVGGGRGGSSTWEVQGQTAGGTGGGGSLQCCPAQGSSGGPGTSDGSGYGGFGMYTIPGNGSGGGGGGVGSPGSNSQDWIYTNDGWITKGGDGGNGLKNNLHDPPNGEYGKWMPSGIRDTYFSEQGFVGGGGGGGCSQPGGAWAPSYTGGGRAKHGGGNGAVGFNNGTAGRQFSGGGGGGGGQTDSPYRYAAGGAGGSGVVMMRYRFKPTESNDIVALASGGTINLNAGDGYVYHTFKSTDRFDVLIDDLDCEVLVVGGGGAAQADRSGGGGGGGVVYDTSLKLRKGSYLAEIGSGGSAVGGNYFFSPLGQITGQGIPTTFAGIVAYGGGAGGYSWGTRYFPTGYGGSYAGPAIWGGSGGGNMIWEPTYTAGSYQTLGWTNNPSTRFHYGSRGGNSSPSNTLTNVWYAPTTYAAGGGGGAGGVGGAGDPGTSGLGGLGGVGVSIPAFPYARTGITPDGMGSSHYGGGGVGYTPANQGASRTRGVGGGGGRSDTNGWANLGGGGGNGGYGSGGAGVVIIRYKVNDPDYPTNTF